MPVVLMLYHRYFHSPVLVELHTCTEQCRVLAAAVGASAWWIWHHRVELPAEPLTHVAISHVTTPFCCSRRITLCRQLMSEISMALGSLGLTVCRRVAVFYVHQMNCVKSGNGCAMMTAP